eukprot:1080082-Rhodomonas_salina.1
MGAFQGKFQAGAPSPTMWHIPLPVHGIQRQFPMLHSPCVVENCFRCHDHESIAAAGRAFNPRLATFRQGFCKAVQ